MNQRISPVMGQTFAIPGRANSFLTRVHEDNRTVVEALAADFNLRIEYRVATRHNGKVLLHIHEVHVLDPDYDRAAVIAALRNRLVAQVQR